jgi:hypothetical protein
MLVPSPERLLTAITIISKSRVPCVSMEKKAYHNHEHMGCDVTHTPHPFINMESQV